MNAIKVTCVSVILTFSPPAFSQSERGGGPPPWAPAHGYRAKTQHVYFPSLNIYFDVHRNSYYFLSGNRWIISQRLPPAIPLPLLRSAPKVELSIVTPTPYYFNEQHRIEYKAPNSLPRPKGPVIYPSHPSNNDNKDQVGQKPGNTGPKDKTGSKPGNTGAKPGNAAPKPGNAGQKPDKPGSKSGNAGSKPDNAGSKPGGGNKGGGK